jgi:Calx-beta domain/Secretion system C-terminal sorting domain
MHININYKSNDQLLTHLIMKQIFTIFCLFMLLKQAAAGDGMPPQQTITSDASGIRISINDTTIVEGDKSFKEMRFTVQLNKSAAKTITVKYDAQDGNASFGSDYIVRPDTLTFLPGTTKILLTVWITGDTKPERNETFSILLHKPVNATIADGIGIGTIVDNDGITQFNSSAKPQTQPAQTVNLFPNPTSGKTNLELTGFSGKVLIQITNGDEVMQRYVVKTSLSYPARQYIDLGDYKAGIYLVTITDEQGNHKTEELMLWK